MADDLALSHAETLLIHAARPSEPLRKAVRLVLDRIAELEAERDRLSVEIDRQISATVDALAERDAALADVAKLREALAQACEDGFSDPVAAFDRYLDAATALVADTEEAKSDG